MTPANVAEIDSVTPGTEVEQIGKIDRLCRNVRAIETLLAGSIALIEKGLELHIAVNLNDGKPFLQSIMLIEEAVRQAGITQTLLALGMMKEFDDGEKLAAEAVQSGTRADGAL